MTVPDPVAQAEMALMEARATEVANQARLTSEAILLALMNNRPALVAGLLARASQNPTPIYVSSICAATVVRARQWAAVAVDDGNLAVQFASDPDCVAPYAHEFAQKLLSAQGVMEQVEVTKELDRRLVGCDTREEVTDLVIHILHIASDVLEQALERSSEVWRLPEGP